MIWFPPSMMSAIAVLLVVNNLRVHEEAAGEDHADVQGWRIAKSWTGR